MPLTGWTISGSVILDPAGNPATPAQLQAAAADDPVEVASLTARVQNTNAVTLRMKAANALTTNTTYLAIPSPTTAQAVAQVKALTLEVDALIRLVANVLDSTSGA